MMWKRALWLWRSVKFWWYITAIWWCTMFCCIDTLESASLSNQHRAGMVLLGGPTFRKWIGINPLNSLNTNHQVIFLHLHHFLWDANLLDIHPVHGPIMQHGPTWSNWIWQEPPWQEGMKLSDTYYLVDMSTDGTSAASPGDDVVPNIAGKSAIVRWFPSYTRYYPFILLKSLFHWGVRWSRDLVMQHATDTLLLPLRDGHAIAKLARFQQGVGRVWWNTWKGWFRPILVQAAQIWNISVKVALATLEHFVTKSEEQGNQWDRIHRIHELNPLFHSFPVNPYIYIYIYICAMNPWVKSC